MSSNEFNASPSSSAVWPEARTGFCGSASLPPASSAAGAQEARATLPATTPAALMKSRREKYTSLGVISYERTGTDLNGLLMGSPLNDLLALSRAKPPRSFLSGVLFGQQCLNGSFRRLITTFADMH